MSGPKAITLVDETNQYIWDAEQDLAFIMVPLLKNPTTKELYIRYEQDEIPQSCNFAAIKNALESNQGLESLKIINGIDIQALNDLKILFQGIAAAPKLRTLELEHMGAVSTHQQSEMLATALIDCQNNSLEEVDRFGLTILALRINALHQSSSSIAPCVVLRKCAPPFRRRTASWGAHAC
jgi:hypothetical protein